MIPENVLAYLLNKDSWRVLGGGTYNTVSVTKHPLTIDSITSYWVYKLPRPNPRNTLNTVPRALRKWHEINPTHPAYEIGRGWIAPYLGYLTATDAEIAAKVIEIYRTTRNIVADATARGNVLRTPSGEIVCIDVDQALRAGSPDSDRFYHQSRDLASHQQFFRDYAAIGYPLSVKVIRTLRYLEHHLSQEQIRNPYIRYDVLSKLHVFQQYSEPVTEQTVAMLLTIANLDPDNEIPEILLDRSLIDELVQLQARGQQITKETIITLTSIHHHIAHGRFDRVRHLIQRDPRLLEQRDAWGFNPIHTAAEWGQTDIVRYLVTQGANFRALMPNAQSAIGLALLYNRDETALFLFDSNAPFQGYVPGQNHMIHVLAKHNRHAQIYRLGRMAPNFLNATDRHHQTPLALAAAAGHDDTVRCLLALGANMNFIPPIPPMRAEDSYTPLDWAFVNGHSSTVNVLRAAGARTTFVYRTYKGKTLSELIRENNFADVQILVGQNKALLNTVDENGLTPAALAKSLGYPIIETYLVSEQLILNFSTMELSSNSRLPERPYPPSSEQTHGHINPGQRYGTGFFHPAPTSGPQAPPFPNRENRFR